MKLHFEPNLDYQHDAIEAVCDLFRGQEICRTEFTVTRDAARRPKRYGFRRRTISVSATACNLLDDEILANLSDIQLRNGLRPSICLPLVISPWKWRPARGKPTSICAHFELNRRYGFTKFVIVVPSVAIKEGVYKTLQITEDHSEACTPTRPSSSFYTIHRSSARCAISPPARIFRSWW